jgi:hypothetical protein
MEMSKTNDDSNAGEESVTVEEVGVSVAAAAVTEKTLVTTRAVDRKVHIQSRNRKWWLAEKGK